MADVDPSAAPGEIVLVVLLVPRGTLADTVAALLDVGAAATALDTRGLAEVIKREVPLFAGIAEPLPIAPEGRLLISLTTRGCADQLLKALRELPPNAHPVRAVVVRCVDALNVAGIGSF